MMQWKEELRTVDDRVRSIVGVKDQARVYTRADLTVGALLNACFLVREEYYYYTLHLPVCRYCCSCFLSGCEF